VGAIVVAFAGCVLMSGVVGPAGSGAPGLSLPGLLVGVGAGVGYALYSIFSRFALNRGYHPLTIVAWTFIIAGVGGALTVDVPHVASMLAAEPGNVLLVALYGLVPTALPYLFYTMGLLHIENSRAIVFATVEPVMATLLGFVVFAELPSAVGFVGMVLVVGAVTALGSRKGFDVHLE
jgi:drug/metabolite transporter (DMT)-like permease